MNEQKGELDVERQKTYGKLVTVQEDLLKTLRKMQVIWREGGRGEGEGGRRGGGRGERNWLGSTCAIE
jgi:hypothetical protein